MARRKSEKELKAIFSKKTKNGLTIKILKGDNVHFHEDFFKVVGDDSPQLTQSKDRALEIANAKVRSQDKRFERLLEEKARKSKHDICGVCGSELKDKGTCKKCDAKEAKKARNWSTMTTEQRERFFRNHGLENEFSIKQQAKLPFNKLTSHWQQELKKDGFGK